MKRETQLRRRLQTLGTLSDAIGAMKSLAASHFRSARAMVPTARSYHEGVNEVLAHVEMQAPPASSAPRALLLVGADLGLCGDYTSRLAQAAVAERLRLGNGPTYCMGRRSLSTLRRAACSVDRIYAAPASVAGLTELLLQVAGDVFDDYHAGKISGLDAVWARFEGAGRFSASCTAVLPVEPPSQAIPFPRTRFVSTARLAAVVTREWVFTTLYQILLEALASEHGARLVAAQSAEGWLKARREETQRALTNLRRESATQEVLEIANGSRSSHRKGR